MSKDEKRPTIHYLSAGHVSIRYAPTEDWDPVKKGPRPIIRFLGFPGSNLRVHEGAKEEFVLENDDPLYDVKKTAIESSGVFRDVNPVVWNEAKRRQILFEQGDARGGYPADKTNPVREVAIAGLASLEGRPVEQVEKECDAKMLLLDEIQQLALSAVGVARSRKAAVKEAAVKM